MWLLQTWLALCLLSDISANFAQLQPFGMVQYDCFCLCSQFFFAIHNFSNISLDLFIVGPQLFGVAIFWTNQQKDAKMYFDSYKIQLLVSWNENRNLIWFHLEGIFNLRPLPMGLEMSDFTHNQLILSLLEHLASTYLTVRWWCRPCAAERRCWGRSSSSPGRSPAGSLWWEDRVQELISWSWLCLLVISPELAKLKTT